MASKPTLAFFGPLLPLKSGVAEYSSSLLQFIAQDFDINAYIDEGYTPHDIGADNINIFPANDYKGREDLSLFQPSNGPLHAYMYPYLLAHGGVCTLHDATLFDMVMIYWEGKSRLAFWRDFIRNEGASGIRKLIKRDPGDTFNPSALIIKNLYADELHKRERFKFLKRVVDSSHAIITHSQYVADAARVYRPEMPILETMLGVEQKQITKTTSESRTMLELAKHGISDETFVVISYGHIQFHKRIPQCLEAFAKFSSSHPDARYILLGPRSPSVDVEKVTEALGISDKVMVIDNYPPMEVVNDYLNAADICLNLRWPAFGSNSYTLVQSLAAGVPTAVTDIETFAEYPDDVVMKVQWDSNDEVKNIANLLDWAESNPDKLTSYGAKGREFIKLNCTWEVIGKKYISFLNSILK